MAVGEQTTEWRVSIPKQLDADLRGFLRDEGQTGPDALSSFVADAVADRLFEEAAQRAKLANRELTEAQILAAVDESLDWARSQQ